MRRFFSKEKLEWFDRAVTTVFFVTCLTLLIIQGKKCVDRYVRGETALSMEIAKTQNATFPSFSVCPNYSMAYKEEVLEAHGTNSTSFKRGLAGNEFPPGVTANGFFDLATPGFDELVRGVDIKQLNGRFVPAEESWWTAHRVQKHGRCYSLDLPKDVTERGINRMKFHLNHNTLVYLHHPGQFTHADSTSRIQARIGKMMFVDVIHEIDILLPDPERGRECDRRSDSGFDRCFYTEVAEIFMDKYGCVSPMLPDDLGLPFCDYSKFNSSEQLKFTHTYYSHRDICPPPCSTLSVFVGFPILEDLHESKGHNASFIKFYFRQNVRVRSSVYAYEFLSMVAEIGGYTGLLLGFSFFNLSTVVKKLARVTGRK